MKRAWGVVIVLVAGIACVGCAGAEAQPEASGQWTAPAWMASQKQEVEQFVDRLQTCMDNKGWNLTMDEFGGMAEPFTSDEELNRAVNDSDACLADLGFDMDVVASTTVTEKQLREDYQRDIDTYQCLVNAGLKMQDPPTEDVYVENGLSLYNDEVSAEGADLDQTWLPYLDPAVLSVGEDDLERLRVNCPERWSLASAAPAS